jgi:hypothetical protein
MDMYGFTTFTDSKGMGNALFGPFKDAIMVGIAETKKTIESAKLAAKIVLGSMKNIIPGLKTDWKGIFSTHNQAIKGIRSKYKQSYDNVFSTFTNGDTAIVTMMWYPSLFFTGHALKKTGEAISKITDSNLSNNNKKRIFEVDERSDQPLFDKKMQADMLAASKVYKQDVTNEINGVVDQSAKFAKMSDDEIVKTLQLSDQMATLNQAASKDKGSEKAKGTLELIKSQQAEIVKQVRKTMVEQFEKFAKALEEQATLSDSVVGEFNKKIEGVDVTADKIGMSNFLRESAKKVRENLKNIGETKVKQ